MLAFALLFGAVAAVPATTGGPSYAFGSNCTPYGTYASVPHAPYSEGPLALPFQRPPEQCRAFASPLIEEVIKKISDEMQDKDLAMLFTNCFPNTLDTTIRWHVDNSTKDGLPRTFIITGDINAQWLRDSRYQVYNYHVLAKYDKQISKLLEGAIHTHAEFVAAYPYCNAFHPPPESGITVNPVGGSPDRVTPPIDKKVVWECMFELDSLASFFGLANDHYAATGSTHFIDDNWIRAANTALDVIESQRVPTFAANGNVNPAQYTFERETWSQGTLPLSGYGNPVNNNTKLIRSPVRPSDDVGIFQFSIPSNALISVELARAAKMLHSMKSHEAMVKKMDQISKEVREDVLKFGGFDHPFFGHVLAYEVDGYGSRAVLDDANVPSLLSLPDIGFLNRTDETYKNTRKMVLSPIGNPYFVRGPFFSGIGGPHVGFESAWPMSHITAIRTTDNDTEIRSSLDILKKSTAGFGLMHESVSVNEPKSFTRAWFAWVNTEFARSIIDLAERKPNLLFKNKKRITLDHIAKDFVSKH